MTSDPQAERLLTTLTRFNRWTNRRALADHDVVVGRLLSLVDELQPARISTLAAADHTTQPTMTTHVRRLEDEGLLTRRPDPDDARATLVSLSAEGERRLRDVRAARAAALLPHLADLDEDDLVALTRAADVLDRIRSREAPPPGD